MTAYAQYSAVALIRGNFNEIHTIATAVLTPGDIVQLASDEAAVYAGAEVCAVGDPIVLYRTGVYDVLCAAASDIYAAGAPVYFDLTAKTAKTTAANSVCILLGRAVTAKTSGSTRVTVELNDAKLAKSVGAAVAAAGSSKNDAAALSAATTVQITSDGAGKGVILPAGVAGDIKILVNGSAIAAVLYPASGGTLNGLAADAGDVIPASTGLLCLCTAANTWIVCVLTAKATAA